MGSEGTGDRVESENNQDGWDEFVRRANSELIGSGHKVSGECKEFIAKLCSMINQLVTI